MRIDKAIDKLTLEAQLETSGAVLGAPIKLECFERWMMMQFHELDDLQFGKCVHAMLMSSPQQPEPIEVMLQNVTVSK